MKSVHLSLVLLLAFFPGFYSCSRAEPKILYGFIELIYYQGKGKADERYSFFILPEDDDGIENLSELYLYNDREGLRWLFTSDDWIKIDEDGKTWIGSRNLAMYDDFGLPRGQYRAVLVNKGGERSERKFTYDGPETSPYPFPDFVLEDGMFRIDSQYPENRLICFDQQGKFVQTIKPEAKEGSTRNLRLQNTVRTIALWAEDSEYHISALTDAAAIR
jgi:hypothetical protein